MNKSTFVISPVLSTRETATSAQPVADSAVHPRTVKTTAAVTHPLTARPPDAPSISAQPTAKPDAASPEITAAPDTASPQRTTFWSRVVAMFHRADRPTPERRAKRERHERLKRQDKEHVCPRRPEFVADAAMKREMFRL